MHWFRKNQQLLSVASICVFVGALLGWQLRPWFASSIPSGLSNNGTSGESLVSNHDPTVIEFNQSLWEPASIEFETVSRGDLVQNLKLTGKITLNEDHVAHIFPMVEGRVDHVNVKYGQRVKKGETLVVIQSREIGQANLTLYQDRVLRESATIKNQWNQDVAKNTRSLIEAIKAKTPISTIEGLFKSKIIGSYREKLLSAYVNLNKSAIDLERTRSLSEQEAIANKQLLAAEATFNADRATLQSLLEQLDQEAQYAALLSEQAVREAETRVKIDETNFRILGYSEFLQPELDLQKSGDSLGQFHVIAPFDGTIISKDVVLMELASPTKQMLTLADLSTVWVATDVYEQHLPIVEKRQGQQIAVRTSVWPDREFAATIFYTGELINENSRTIGMRSMIDNSEGLLKPGMFVNVEIPGTVVPDVVRIPSDAILDHEGKSFVFVHLEGAKFQQRAVTLGRVGQASTEVLTGLRPGESIVVKGGFALKSKLLEDLVAGE